jgi:hypothetical protein
MTLIRLNYADSFYNKYLPDKMLNEQVELIVFSSEKNQCKSA